MMNIWFQGFIWGLVSTMCEQPILHPLNSSLLLPLPVTFWNIYGWTLFKIILVFGSDFGHSNIHGFNNNNIQFLETHNTIKNSLYACEKSKYETEITKFQN